MRQSLVSKKGLGSEVLREEEEAPENPILASTTSPPPPMATSTLPCPPETTSSTTLITPPTVMDTHPPNISKTTLKPLKPFSSSGPASRTRNTKRLVASSSDATPAKKLKTSIPHKEKAAVHAPSSSISPDPAKGKYVKIDSSSESKRQSSVSALQVTAQKPSPGHRKSSICSTAGCHFPVIPLSRDVGRVPEVMEEGIIL